MSQKPSIAALLDPEQRKKLAIKVLTKSQSITNLAREEQVSRKFLYQQKQKAKNAIDDAFTSVDINEKVLFYLPITKTWLRKFILALILICHISYRVVKELLRDLFDYKISITSIHNLMVSRLDLERFFFSLLIAERFRAMAVLRASLICGLSSSKSS